MKKTIFSISLLFLIVFLSCTKDKEIKAYSTIVGNVYIAKDRTTNLRPLYLIYSFTEDGKIIVKERFDSEDGELYDESTGSYTYNHPELKLTVRSIKGCEACFNYFTASVTDDRRSFMYKIWDMTINNTRDLKFDIKE